MNSDKLFDMHGQNVLVTGGGTGLGRTFATVLAARGARIYLAARRVEKLAETAELIAENGGEAHCFELDVTQAESVKQCIARTNAIGPVTVLINNAGTASDLLLKDLSESQWDSVLDTNLKGAWLMAREVVSEMAERGEGGVVVNISSVLGSCVQMGTGSYAAAKAGLAHLTRAMAYEWGRHGIRVNTLCPGYYHTEMAEEFLSSAYGEKLQKNIPLRRLGQTSDLEGTILLLASNASSYMTGASITVDGGLSLSTI